MRHGPVIFVYHVRGPQRYGVVEFDKDGMAVSPEEKPERPRSSLTVPGVYLYDYQPVEIARQLKL